MPEDLSGSLFEYIGNKTVIIIAENYSYIKYFP